MTNDQDRMQELREHLEGILHEATPPPLVNVAISLLVIRGLATDALKLVAESRTQPAPEPTTMTIKQPAPYGRCPRCNGSIKKGLEVEYCDCGWPAPASQAAVASDDAQSETGVPVDLKDWTIQQWKKLAQESVDAKAALAAERQAHQRVQCTYETVQVSNGSKSTFFCLREMNHVGGHAFSDGYQDNYRELHAEATRDAAIAAAASHEQAAIAEAVRMCAETLDKTAVVGLPLMVKLESARAAILATLPAAVLASLKAREQELEALKAWKESASKVLHEIDLQECSKVMGLTLGASIGPAILPFLRETAAREKRIVEVMRNVFADLCDAHASEVEAFKVLASEIRALNPADILARIK